jgi:hypothetical protein
VIETEHLILGPLAREHVERPMAWVSHQDGEGRSIL